MKMNTIEAVIFDWGGVLVDNPVPVLMTTCAQKLNIESEKLRRIYNAFAYDFQTNRIQEKILWKKISEKLGIQQISLDSLWLEAFKRAYTPKKEVFQLLKILKKNGYKTGLLSNTEKKVMDYYYQLNYQMIDVAVFSCQEGIVKPDQRIYEIILEKMAVKPDAVVFIDDRDENIKGAEKLGINTILFHTPVQVKKELIQLGVNLDDIRS